MDTSDSEGCFESADEEFYSGDEGDDTVEEVSVKEKDENIPLKTVRAESNSTAFKNPQKETESLRDKKQKSESEIPPEVTSCQKPAKNDSNDTSEYGIPPERSVCWEPGVNEPYNTQKSEFGTIPEVTECWEPGVNYDVNNETNSELGELSSCWEPGVNEPYNGKSLSEFAIPPAREVCWFPEVNNISRQEKSPVASLEKINKEAPKGNIAVKGGGDYEKIDNKIIDDNLDNKNEQVDEVVDKMGRIGISDKKNNNTNSTNEVIDNINSSKLDESCTPKQKNTVINLNENNSMPEKLKRNIQGTKTLGEVTSENKSKHKVNLKEEDETTPKETQCDNKVKVDNKKTVNEPSQKGDLWNEDDGWGLNDDEEKTEQSSHDSTQKTEDPDKKLQPEVKISDGNEEEDLWDHDDDWEIKTEKKDVEKIKIKAEVKKDEENLWEDDDWVEETATKSPKKPSKAAKEEDLWGDDDDWLDGDDSKSNKMSDKASKGDVDITKAFDSLTQSNKDSAWGGWGNWGISSVLSTAANITSSVSQGITTVLETGIGVPDPEELARLDKAEEKTSPQSEINPESQTPSFGLTNLVSGVTSITKLVETTSTKVISGGLDTLETIGKKTMEVLQETDPGLKRGRAFLKIDQDKPVLSQILREAKEKAEEVSKQQTHYVKKANYEMIFDDHQGLVHLEALEMLSKQCEIKLESVIRKTPPSGLADLQETLDQVKELCELLDEDEEDGVNIEEVKEKIDAAVEDIKVPLSYTKLLERWGEMESWLSDFVVEKCDEDEIHKNAIETLAELTAIAVEQYHKCGELLLIKEHRSTADEADSLVQLTTVLTRLISSAATKFSEKLNTRASHSGNKDSINSLITNVFLESANSSRYLQDAFQLLIPVIQVGAV